MPKKTLLLVAIVACIISTASFASQEEDIRSKVDAVCGQEFNVVLPSNPTTGYSWQLARPINEKYVTLVGSKFVKDFDGLVGSGGKEIWTFKAVKAGKSRVILHYIRPWVKHALFTRKAVIKVVIK